MKHANLNNRIKKFYNDVKDYVLLPNMNQSQGWWYDATQHGSKCCFGARVAKAYNIIFADDPKVYSYVDGRNQMTNALNIKSVDLILILWLCGATNSPFGSSRWIRQPKFVMNKLLKIEREPTNAERFILKRFYHSNLNVWQDYEYIDRKRVKLNSQNRLTCRSIYDEMCKINGI